MEELLNPDDILTLQEYMVSDGTLWEVHTAL